MRYIILSDIHANYPALEEVARIAERYRRNGQGVQFCCLGDVLGYGSLSGAQKCLNWLRTSGASDFWFPGNHDDWIVRQIGAVQDEALITLRSQHWYLQREAPDDWDWFARRVNELVDFYNEGKENDRLMTIHPDDGSNLALVLTHGKAERGFKIGMYAEPWKVNGLQTSLENVGRANPGMTAVWLYGHTHLPVCARLKQGQVRFCSIKYGKPMPLEGVVGINPGSVGQPRDGDNRASFAVIDSQAMTVTFRRAEYDWEGVQAELRRESNPDGQIHPLLNRGAPHPRKDLNEVKALLKAQYPESSDAQLREHWKKAYEELIHRIETADGKTNMQAYHEKVYRRPLFDLEAVQQLEDGF
jgi:predicted phosphodiesterase